ncbi:hypothetical protein SKAU_G00034140 [Synaphobranchus kaupii]|uniref:Alkylated DNA repair protein AlkB homologue 8 N-terminal domain-containing protein n=1 Tax=Synaphobranchus kaupii TaxID=118154 RepID=A0A9Q1GE80_SYNKA|nr:hypothetical protein SKAU_G00034140 [Synaphobranchus kaupii]
MSIGALRHSRREKERLIMTARCRFAKCDGKRDWLQNEVGSDCRSLHPNRHLVKFADDTVLLSLLSGPILDHGPALTEFVEWCDSSCLELTVTKTKEMFVDFSRRQAGRTAAIINGEPVDAVHQYKYLGTVFDDKLRFEANTEVIIKKCQQRQYFLRKLHSFGVSRNNSAPGDVDGS